jgi:hypothetical protein
MAPITRQRNVSDSNEAQEAIEQLLAPHIQTNQEQTPQTLSAALAEIRQLQAANDTLKQNYVQLQTQHVLLHIRCDLMEEDHDRSITNEDTVEEENDNLRDVLDKLQDKYHSIKAERDHAIDKQYLAEEEAFILLAHLQICRNEAELLYAEVQDAGVQ